MNLSDAYLKAVKSMAGDRPDGLTHNAEFHAKKGSPPPDVSPEALRAHLDAADTDDELRKRLHMAIAAWDAQGGGDWTESTAAHSDGRRNLVYSLLELDQATADAFDDAFPRISTETVVIDDGEIKPWYTDEVQSAHDFYWDAYQNYLLDHGWDAKAVKKLDLAAKLVVEHLADPTNPAAQKAKGIVVGYVQSGKTANYTGVIAKAIDAGYRLVIVLAGTTDILRQQTQRRLDMELVGTENIYLGVDPSTLDDSKDIDYLNDPGRLSGNFLSFGFRPSLHDYPDIIRLTSHGSDYRNLKAGITTLEFEKRDKHKPLFAKENLYASNARLAVIKKNAFVLRDLVTNLSSISSLLGQIPTLIVDDESDQASLNTTNPKDWQDGETQRSSINCRITGLLKLLGRAQYVGYTATPYANVFVDPSDVEDIFPTNFLISLERPKDYMGGADFLDLDASFEEDEGKNVATSNEKAYVRDLTGTTDAEVDTELLRALDAFLLSGAIKLFRTEHVPKLRFRHHTMMVHESVKKATMKELAEQVKRLWSGAGYANASGQTRLANLLESDFRPTRNARAPQLPFPDNYQQLKPYVGKALGKIQVSNGNPVLIVNSDKDLDQEDLDFQQKEVWRILVGGAKLSRGFTVEGLTVSYYLRRTGWGDALMQMGRWFGFRPGYKDLVRLFIGRAVQHGKKTYDLYEMFEAAELDERAFREELERYSKPVNGERQITPRDIPPLVSQHLMPPAAPNKMYNAELVIRRSPGRPIEPTAYPKDPQEIASNYTMMLPLFKAAETTKSLTFPPLPTLPKGGKFQAYLGVVSADTVLNVLHQLIWVDFSDQFRPDLAYLEEITPKLVDDWVLIAPQLQKNQKLDGLGDRSVFARERRRDPLFGAISDPKHRQAALRIAEAISSYGDPDVDSLAADKRGAVLLYPIATKDKPDQVITAFTLVPPAAAITGNGRIVQFKAKDSKSNKPIVDRPKNDPPPK